ncbi:hypothetical protein FT663_00911 [Candidozyma haemuli var. vulneris]|uniref:BRO domain-containing protein 1 n=1 Tax=Candidozyma haemuli TaxID=45357 RepID=A0A2V1AT42_9ASCO|nr:hypothetical protein CXQ85_001891 [[Candida] haemuloni]KAF3993087.1 hypothetical protein FT662_00715 [[Candida] haemuloni var. vulneris]KAF3994937.1 hypothetical protein FT663_00911 [[Candida] haemuloni var. vulneris]PVH20111.1 hypothetical protein CXQ85_001891 [[Candida] haemuloni]
MKATLLLVPTKKTDDVNWVKPINNYLLSIYGETSEFQQDLASFNKLRQDIRGVNADSTGIGLYFKYFSQLELLDLRIPIATVNRHKKLNFTWYDAFSPSAQHKQYALPFEKAGVLFNLASLMSKAASIKYNESQKSSTADDSAFKEAVQYLQQAAGIFDFVGESFLHAPSNDLNPATVKFLKGVCLAQSQEIFTLKVIDGDLEQKKNSLISKLCKSTATQYENCFSNCSHLLNIDSSSPADQSTFAIVEAGLDDDDGLDDIENDPLDEYNPDKQGLPESHVTARLDPFWVAVLQVKSLYYKSLSYYFQGLQLETTHKYGDAIAYLSKSLESINEVPTSSLKKISKAGSDDAYDLLDNLKYHKDALEIKLKELNKDNDLVYHEIVPSLVTLAEPKPMDSSKIIPMSKIELFAKINEQSYDNFLKNVVPMNIHELLSYYSEEKSQFLRNELDEVDVSNEELSSVLEYLKLPKALANIKEILQNNESLSSGSTSEQSIDPAVLGKVDEISMKYPQDSNNRAKISDIRNRILTTVGESDAILKESFSESSARFKDDLIKLKRALYDAANSDAKLFALVDVERSSLHALLSKGTNSKEFKSLFDVPKSATSKEPTEEISLLDMDDSQMNDMSHEGQISTLEDILHNLNVLKSNKNKLVERLKEEIHNDDISEILMLNSKVKSPNEIKSIIFPEELKKFEVFSQQLDDLINEQKSLVNDLKEKWTKLSSNPKVKEVQTSKTFRDEVVKQQTQRINDFYENYWRKYSVGLDKGAEYYSKLLTMAENLKRAIDSDKSNSLSESISRMNLGANSTGGSTSSNQFFSSYRRDQQPPAQAPQSFAQYSPYNQGSYEQQASMSGFGQPPLQPAGTGGPPPPQRLGSDASLRSSYSRPAPALPPKRPSLTNEESTIPQQHSFGAAQGQNKPQTSGGLIYDEPSTYQPNMYDFFKK